ncbi:unnamed protein product [marine sediment metagenome]|uniref:Uncharacterized protein n=1 Tax=marine sediment metagenome TaxID=412755 RepID=X1EDH2_9ZZZZ
MAGKGPRHLIKRELDRATNNLEMFKNHLFTIRQQCEIGNRTDLMTFVDQICKGAIALQSTIDGFGLMVDGKIPVTGPDSEA